MNNVGFNVIGFGTIFKKREETLPLKDSARWITPKLIDDLPKIVEEIHEEVIQKISGKSKEDAIQEVANVVQSSSKEAEKNFIENAPAIRFDVFSIVLEAQRERFLREEEEVFLLLLALMTRKNFL